THTWSWPAATKRPEARRSRDGPQTRSAALQSGDGLQFQRGADAPHHRSPFPPACVATRRPQARCRAANEDIEYFQRERRQDAMRDCINSTSAVICPARRSPPRPCRVLVSRADCSAASTRSDKSIKSIRRVALGLPAPCLEPLLQAVASG